MKIYYNNIILNKYIKFKNFFGGYIVKYVNVKTEAVLDEKEFNAMCEREYKDSWDNNLNIIVDEFKGDGKTFKDYLNYMKDNDTGIFEDFEIIK